MLLTRGKLPASVPERTSMSPSLERRLNALGLLPSAFALSTSIEAVALINKEPALACTSLRRNKTRPARAWSLMTMSPKVLATRRNSARSVFRPMPVAASSRAAPPTSV